MARRAQRVGLALLVFAVAYAAIVSGRVAPGISPNALFVVKAVSARARRGS